MIYSDTKMTDLESNMKLLNINESCVRGECYANLNNVQKIVYDDIQVTIAKKKNAVILIDSLSGTGKTFLLTTLAAKYKGKVNFIAFRKDQASDVSLKGILSDTYVSFCMKYLKLQYKHAIHMFHLSGTDDVQQLYRLILYSKQYIDPYEMKVIMLDTYTIAPPQMLLLLYIIALKNHIDLIFAGSRLQLSAIIKSSLHGQNNFSLVQMLNDRTVKMLCTNMRMRDSVLETKVANVRKALQTYESDGRVPFYFNLRYRLYSLFRSKYFTKERFDTVYMAHTHNNIKKRLLRFIDHLKATSTPYVEAPFLYRKGKFISVPMRSDSKFLPYLILVKGCKYIYINENGVHSIVQLVEILYDSKEVCALQVRYVHKNNEVIVIKPCILNYYQILPAYRSWLLKDLIHTDELFQFPLRQYTLTYHAALGRTIETEDVELNVDCPYGNFMYIGLSCVRHDAAIHKIHTERDLLGYVVTEYMEQEHADFDYYYRCPNVFRNQILEYVSNKEINKFIERIDWTDVENVNTFEAKGTDKFLRIKRNAYKQSDKGSCTPSMELVKFIKENPNVILNAMNMATGEDQTRKKKQNVKKGKSHQSDAVSPAYAYLKKEYDMWTASNLKEIA